jgi:organic hydroperoxide reductase OsmC/OhrA
MAEHQAHIRWHSGGEFSHESYNKEHLAQISGHDLPMASANTEGFSDPEQALAASVASCHMLTFLALAAKKRLIVEQYEDHPIAFSQAMEDGRFWVSKIQLQPKVVFTDDHGPSDEALKKMHEKAHHHCFIANSLRSEVEVLS